MAKQDLYKTAQQSAKLFKLIQDEKLLESWVKNKITKAAEDISTVYQYLNYEKQFQDYSKMIAESTNLSEGKRAALTEKLMEAKDKVKELKKKAAKEKSEKMDEDKEEMKVGDTKKTRTGELTKTSTGVVHKNTSYKDDGDEIASNAKSGKGIKSHAKAETAAEKKEKAPALKKSKTGTWGMENGEKFDNRKVSEAKKELKGGQKELDQDDDGDIEADDLADLRAKKKKTEEGAYLGKRLTAEGKKCPICKKDPCTCGKSKTKKAEPAKKKVDEADMGKHNNGKTTGFKAVAKAAGGGEKGEKIAGAQLAKMKASGKIKEAVARARDVLEGKAKKGAKPDFLDMDKDGDKKEPMKKAVADKKAVVKESTELDRMKTIMQRLNG